MSRERVVPFVDFNAGNGDSVNLCTNFKTQESGKGWGSTRVQAGE